MTRQEKEFEKIVEPIVEKLGYKFYDVEYIKEGKEWFLRVYIDSENGIGLEDCEKVSGPISEELDIVDPIQSSYSLEVSSCGLERKLREKRHFDAAISKDIEVKLYKSVDKEKNHIGKLLETDDEGIVMTNEKNEKVRIEYDNISSAKILFNWEE